MVEIKISDIPIKDTIKASEVIGKKVFTITGKVYGRVRDIYLNPRALTLEAIKVDKGIFGKNHYIGKNFIEKITKTGVKLIMDPINAFVGKNVYDKKGKKIGKVKLIEKVGPKKDIFAFVISVGACEEIVIEERDIKKIGDDVQLKLEYIG